MAPERRNQIVLAALVVVLLGSLYQAFAPAAPDTTPTAVPGGVATATATRAAAPTARVAETPDVRLEALDQDRATPAPAQRNLFRFRPRVAPTAAPAPARAGGPAVPTRPPAPAVPTVPPISLKFIGVVEATEKSQTYAVLRDDRGVYHGREGDIIEGRYRIIRIGAESIELSYVDGQGRQTIRLGS